MLEPARVVVLDTHVWIWVMGGSAIADPARAAIAEAASRGAVLVPAISIWELGMLEAKGRLALDAPIARWVEGALRAPGIQLAELSVAIALDSSRLPGDFHGDPADRLIVATARSHGAILVTRDRKILDYGHSGFVNVLEA